MCYRRIFGLFMGYFSLIMYGIGAITFLCCLANRNYIDRLAREEAQLDVHLDVNSYKSYLRGTFACFLSISCMMVVISGLLIRGIIKSRHKYLLPWMLLMALSIGCNFIYNIVVVFKVKYAVLKFFMGMLGMAIQCLLLYPIFNLYREMRDENHRLASSGRTRDYPHLIRVL